MMKFGSKSIRSECVHISVYIVCRHSDCGMEGYKLLAWHHLVPVLLVA